MLKNHYDNIVIGRGYLSLLSAIKSTAETQSVLLIDDNRFQTESHQNEYISDLELRFISEIGVKYGLVELQDFNECLSLRPYQLHGEKTSVLLGMGPYQNAKELWRKYSSHIGSETFKLLMSMDEGEFNLWYNSEIVRFTNEMKNAYAKGRQLKFQFQGPHYILEWINSTKKWLSGTYSGPDSLSARVLVHLSSTLFEDKIKKYLDDSDFAYYFLRWISPLYHVDGNRLSLMLERSLSHRGGDIKKANVQDWQIHENKLFHILLSSFEGVISMDKTKIFGHLPIDIPFSSISNYQIYQFAAVGDLSEEEMNPLSGVLELHFVTETERLGGERPLRHFIFNQNGIRAYYPYLLMPGTRPEFYQDLIYKDAARDFAKFHRPLQKINFNHSRRQMMESSISPLKEAFCTHSWPLKAPASERQILGVSYEGPFKYQRFGIIGHLLSIL